MTREEKIKRVFQDSLYVGDIVDRDYLIDCIELIQENNQNMNVGLNESELDTRNDIAILFRYYAHNILRILRERIPNNLNESLKDMPGIEKVNSLIRHELCNFSAELMLDEIEPDYDPEDIG